MSDSIYLECAHCGRRLPSVGMPGHRVLCGECALMHDAALSTLPDGKEPQP